jgi:DNA-binding NarL/FixJ family response regulator
VDARTVATAVRRFGSRGSFAQSVAVTRKGCATASAPPGNHESTAGRYRASLTPTEQHVADLVAEGLTNPEIAERLLMARGTVKTHLEHLFAKTGLRDRAELAAAVIRQRPQ